MTDAPRVVVTPTGMIGRMLRDTEGVLVEAGDSVDRCRLLGGSAECGESGRAEGLGRLTAVVFWRMDESDEVMLPAALLAVPEVKEAAEGIGATKDAALELSETGEAACEADVWAVCREMTGEAITCGVCRRPADLIGVL